MNKTILFVHLPAPTYTQMAYELATPNHDSYELAGGDEASPTVANEVQRGERKTNVSGMGNAGLNLPLGISYLSSTLKKQFPNNLDQYLADYMEEQKNIQEHKSVEDWIIAVAKKKMPKAPDVVAISLMFSTAYKFFKHLVTIYKKMWPNTQIIVGGTHATNCSQYLLDTTSEVDYVFKGEGEVAIAKFVQNLIDNKPQIIQGVYKREIDPSVAKFNQEGKNMNQKLCVLPDNLDEMPNHNYELFNYEKYFDAAKNLRSYDGSHNKVYEIMGSRGCPFKCSFCSGHSSNDRNVRKRSIEHIMEEIQHIYKKHGINKFLFYDDLFTMKKARFFEMMRAFKNANIPDLLFYTQGFHINVTDEAMIDAIAGMAKSILFAVDSGSQYIQDKIIHKNNKLSRGRELMAHAQRKGLIVRSNFIFGFPTETREIMEESANYMRLLESDWFQIYTAIPLIGTALHEQLLERGILKKRFDEKLWEGSRYGERVFDMDTMSAKELTHYTYNLNLDLNFINNYNLRIGRYDRAVVMFNDLLRRYPTHIFGLISLYMAYEGLNDKQKCLSIEKKIFESLSLYVSSRKMLENYGGLLKDTKFYDLDLGSPGSH
jgi:radical SAM superfamily enzyme YgiQ (UPF0313 family)